MRLFSGLVLAAVAVLLGCGADPRPAAPPAVTSAPASSASSAPAATAAVSIAPAPPPSAAPSATASAAPSEPSAPRVEVVQIAPAGAPGSMPSITVLAPTKNQVIPAAKAAAFAVKLRAAGWDLAEGGNHLCVRVDKHPCRRVTDAKKSLLLGEIDPTLDEGQHVLTVFARRGSGESIKPAGKRAAFASLSFFVGKKAPLVWKDGGPMIFFDPPGDGPSPPGGVLLDVYVANAEIARGKYVVVASVGGPGLGPGTSMVLDSLAPLRLENARAGEYLIRFALMGYQASLGESGSSTSVGYAPAPVPGAFSEVVRSLHVAESKGKKAP